MTNGPLLNKQMTEEPKSKNPNKDLVVVGSSAGGVGALSTLVSTLNKDFPAPIVLAQHLDPQRPSHLGTILERHSKLPIVVVSENPPTPLENGKIYVVPANRHVKISDGFVLLEADHADRPKPSVDRLLSSAAESYGEHLIAVILTGSGSDGAAGGVDVKNAGGLVIVQNPQTAAYPSMPLSLPPTAVDHVSELDLIGPLLYDLLQGVNLTSTEKIEEPLPDLVATVSAQTNIDFRHYKSSTIQRRIARRMAVTRNLTIRDYQEYLNTHPDEVQELVKAFLIKVTGFFRDQEAFEVLKNEILPLLIEQGHANRRTLRLWSAGCATGEEAYSLAMLLADQLGSDFSDWKVKIFATDLASDAIAFARRGFYPENILDELPSDYKERFFERVDHGFRVTKALRQAVIFGHQDLSRGVPFPRIDLVTCRNLLIYLKPELQQVVLDLFAYSLHQSRGFLFLGKAETARPTKANFELLNKKWKIYRCMGGPLALNMPDGTVPDGGVAHRVLESSWRSQIATPPGPGPLKVTHAELEMRRINETMLRYTNVAVIIIDRAYRILTINAAARRMLGIREIASDHDFLHTVRGLPYNEVRGAIDTTFRERSTMLLPEIELDPSVDGSGRYISLTVMPLQVERGESEFAVISATDVTDHVQLKRKLEAMQRDQAEIVTELSDVSRRYNTMNKELQDANEELQAANEELMLTQEELQATNEEFEATNEELQATNEELETNNEELQATNEELQTTNDELTARTLELQEYTRQHQEAQFNLGALLERFPYYVMILDANDLTIKTINPGYKELLGGRNVIDLPLGEVFSGKDIDQLVILLGKATREGKAVTTPPMKAHLAEAADVDETRFIHTIVPITDYTSNAVNRLFIYSEKVR